MQSWCARSWGLSGRGRFLEVGRRADHGHAQVGSNAHGDHVLRDLLAETHPRVETLRHDVGEGVVDRDLHFDVRVVRQEALKSGPEDRRSRMLARAETNGARRLLAQITQVRERGVDLVEPRPHSAEKALARLRGRDAARRTGQETQSQAFFEAADRVAHRRRRYPELRRGAGETPLPRNGEKGEQIVDVLARHS